MIARIYIYVLIATIALMTGWQRWHQFWLCMGLGLAYAVVRHIDYVRVK